MATTSKAAKAVPPGEIAVEGRKVGQVLTAAKRIFLEEGYGSASMDSIAREANVSKATLYAYYPSKEALFAACVAEECSKHRVVYETIEAEHLPIDQALIKVGLQFMRFLLRPEVLAVHRVVVGESGRFPELGKAFYDSGPCLIETRTAEYLKTVSERGELDIADHQIAAELFLAMIKGHVHLRGTLAIARKLDLAELERFIAEAVRVFVAGYRPGRTASPLASSSD
ncbi:TetR/AcrR family transcriptional regulator [Roseiterribacter gracilis]|uniref:TetR family transcriptional regulator n=1 Tax=Roseiterribacter gracilis TaxID=2812848 RepID=A0A8S8XAU5_9PROT|nr:TetR family transcriptional regulator [Rhodospirillales bacterium TMPK1]